jgi:hypothetical protein
MGSWRRSERPDAAPRAELWTPSLSTIAKGADLDTVDVSQLRAGVLLGDGEQKSSRWLMRSTDEMTRR